MPKIRSLKGNSKKGQLWKNRKWCTLHFVDELFRNISTTLIWNQLRLTALSIVWQCHRGSWNNPQAVFSLMMNLFNWSPTYFCHFLGRAPSSYNNALVLIWISKAINLFRVCMSLNFVAIDKSTLLASFQDKNNHSLLCSMFGFILASIIQ